MIGDDPLGIPANPNRVLTDAFSEMRQVFLFFRSKPYSHPTLQTVSLYRLVRHPLMLGFLIAVWFTPLMTYGHLLFSCLITAYILFGIQLEERDLRRFLGPDYERYRENTPMILPVRLGALARSVLTAFRARPLRRPPGG